MKKMLPISMSSDRSVDLRSGFVKPSLFAFFIFLMTSMVASAHGNARIQIRSNDRQSFVVELDGNRTYAQEVWSLNQIATGRHALKVFRERQTGNHGGHGVIFYNGQIDVPQNALMTGVIGQNNTLSFQTEYMNQGGNGQHGKPAVRPAPRPNHGGRPQGHDHHHDGCQDHGGYGQPTCGGQPQPTCGQQQPSCGGQQPGCGQQQPSCGQTTGQNGGCQTNGNGYGNGIPISQQDFQDILSSIDQQWSDDDKMMIAQQAMSNYRWSTEQVMQVMEKFWYESSRLDFAMWAYSRVNDPQRFYKVNDLFWYSSSKKKLQEYIDQYH